MITSGAALYRCIASDPLGLLALFGNADQGGVSDCVELRALPLHHLVETAAEAAACGGVVRMWSCAWIVWAL